MRLGDYRIEEIAKRSVVSKYIERGIEMIQDILPKRFHNEFERRKPSPDSRVLSFQDGAALYREVEGQLTFLSYRQVQEYYERQTSQKLPEAVYLFSVDTEDYFLMDLTGISIAGYIYHKMFETRRLRPLENVLAAATGWHLYVWYRDNRYCGRCSHKLVHDEKLRMMRCPACGNQVFPKIAPAVIVGVTDGDRILMTKYADREYKKYALIAGFTEIGETAEQTVEREVMEEVGLSVKNIRYYKSQPWGYDSNLLLGYFCDLAQEEEIHLDETELSLAEWVDYRDIPDDPEGLSLTREMMITFREQKTRENKE